MNKGCNTIEEIDATKMKAQTAAARKVEAAIIDLQLQIENLVVFIDDDMAVVSGIAYDQATKEKAVLFIGNIDGIIIVADYMTVEHEVREAQFIP